MATVGNNNIRIYIYRGEEGEEIPDDATHINVHKSVTVILADALSHHPNIVEVICHEGVEKIEESAFDSCRSLRRVIVTGVTIFEKDAFADCEALADVECGKLEIIREYAFYYCISLRSINLPSVEIVEGFAFEHCDDLTDVKFSNKLERIEDQAFVGCPSLERITIPLKDGMITGDDLFQGCKDLKHVDLVEGALHETIDALLKEEWRNDMKLEIDSINHTLLNTDAGFYRDFYDPNNFEGEKAHVIQRWIRSVLLKIIHYKAEHQRFVNEAGSTLHHALPHDIVMNNVLSLLVLPSYVFEVEDQGHEEDEMDVEEEMEE